MNSVSRTYCVLYNNMKRLQASETRLKYSVAFTAKAQEFKKLTQTEIDSVSLLNTSSEQLLLVSQCFIPCY